MTNYTEIIDGFQIRDVTYFGESPKNAPIEFEIVKWQYFEPRKVIDFKTGKEKMIDRSCYAVAFLVWNERERHFNFKQVGDRWERADKTKKVIEMLSEFTRKKGEELCKYSFTTAWCYGKNEKTKICPVCGKPIHFGEIMIDGEMTVYHRECGRKKMKGEENGWSNDD